MPPDRSSSRYAFDLTMIDPGVLDTPAGFHTALCAIETVFHRGDSEIAGMVSLLMSRSHILEYIISGMFYKLARSAHRPFRFPVMDQNAFEKLTKCVISGFPTSMVPKMVDTTSMKLLQRLSYSLLFAEYPSAADAPPDLRVFWKKVESSLGVLKELEDYANGATTGPKMSSTSYNRGKRAVKSRHINPLPFDSMGMAVPTTDTEVRDACIEVLAQLHKILEVRGHDRWPTWN